MRLESLELKNFRCFDNKTVSFHPEFNLVVGVNGSGKTALLDAVSVAVASWLLGFSSRPDKRSLSASDASLKYTTVNDEPQFVECWPVVVRASGSVCGEYVEWERSKHSSSGNTRYGDANNLISLAKSSNAMLGGDVNLPLISCYGTMRLWQDPKQTKVKPSFDKRKKPSPMDGYKHCVDPRIATRDLVEWFASQEWAAYQNGRAPLMLKVVKEAVISCIEGAEDLRYDPKRKELILTFLSSDALPFSVLSDGYRCVLSMVADVAQKAVKLNPHLGMKVLLETEGVVLIDELDLHLHPKWQRGLIDDLRQTFPKIQFICTTHSPFLIQSLRSGDELVMLDGYPVDQLGNLPIGEIAEDIMGVKNSDTGARYEEMKSAALDYLSVLNDVDFSSRDVFDKYKEMLSEKVSPYADNPAYQAFLEMQRIKVMGG